MCILQYSTTTILSEDKFYNLSTTLKTPKSSILNNKNVKANIDIYKTWYLNYIKLHNRTESHVLYMSINVRFRLSAIPF